MSEEKRPNPPVQPAPKPASVAVELADAAASSDGLIHQLVALRYTHEQNADKEAADAVTAQLAELGYR